LHVSQNQINKPQNPMATSLELTKLAPEPLEEWERMLRFSGPSLENRLAMSRTVETLMRRSTELVTSTYDYLSSVPETAAILGWEQGIDPSHLEERRRFFTIWLSRTLGIDTSEEFAQYLFTAGQYHAGYGPRQIHTPSAYVTGSIGLVLAAFAQYMSDANLASEVIGGAMAGWSKYLQVQLNQMLLGYQIAIDFAQGDFHIQCNLFGRMRKIVGKPNMTIPASSGDQVDDLLTKFFNFYPSARQAALDRVWQSQEKTDSLWLEVHPVYVPRRGWRVVLNGRDLGFDKGFDFPVSEKDQLSIFPPGR
jgi:molybdopterin converting factor small subunit